ncbi:RNA-binding (RRM/RBD/RNP motifs) family protein [Thalictrum thalictroides]|uniref:RNA-binding (RRM/RBD/RNP motifs) family protein n=1 Tax=Thalictrum thalictroides TaxID=46969 RepID=A0A7J6VZB4_THATH|nr:RNA-binding (RRM/RBD/RNP motifs) family protein [Thalictrum thalictroides]
MYNDLLFSNGSIFARNASAHYVPQNSTPCPTLFVANLAPTCAEQELIEVFSRCPGFLKLKMQNKNGAPVAFVDFQSSRRTKSERNLLLSLLKSYFVDMLRRAKESYLQTVVVGDSSRALGRYADLWVPWVRVENGEIGEEELFSARTRNDAYSQVDDDGGLFSVTEFDGDSDYEIDLDQLLDRLVVPNPGVRMSAFSEGEEEEKWVRDESDKVGTNDHVRKYPSLVEKDLFWDSEGEESDEEDGYL